MRNIKVKAVVTAVIAVSAAACAWASVAQSAEPGNTVILSVDSRPFRVHVPPGYDAGRSVPMVLALHGWTGSSDTVARYLGLIRESNQRNFLLALPEGTTAPDGDQFWNATDACCDTFGSGVDDSTYLSDVIETVVRRYDVDPARVFVVGFSNGGFMAHRLACDHAEQIAAVVSVAGAQNGDASACQPSRPVSVLQVHGMDDAKVRFGGGDGLVGVRYPSASETVATWRELDGCPSDNGLALPQVDSDSSTPGAETTRTSWFGCARGAQVALWTVPGAAHHWGVTADLSDALFDWLEATAKAD